MLTVVLYHNVTSCGPSFEKALDVSTNWDLFAEHVEYYEKNYDIVGLNAVIDGPLPRRPLLITFDDYYRSVLEAARHILYPRGIPAVFFANPSLLGNASVSLDTALFWYEATHGLSALCDVLGIPVQQTSCAGDLLAGPISKLSAAKRTALRDRLLAGGGRTSPEFAERSPVLEPDELALLPPLGVEIGNHTATHVHCRSLTADEHASEIVQAKRKLESLSRSPVRSFSFPYGHEHDATPEVLQSLRKSGHKAIFLVHARANMFRMAPDIWYRISMHNEPTAAFFRKLHLLPLVRTARKMVLHRD